MERMPRIGVIADDLTSATDGASPFIGCGHVPLVLRSPVPDADAHVLAVDMASRSATDGAQAARATAAAVAGLYGDRLLYKTIDSTLRGWIREEIHAAVQASGRRRLVVAPAFPDAGRTTRDGVQYVHGVPVHESSYGRDPVHSARVSAVGDLVAAVGIPVGIVPLDAPDHVVAQLVRPGIQILDSETQRGLNRLVSLVPDPEEVLWIGSPGLAIALAARLGGRQSGLALSQPSSRILVLAGSANPATHAQCSHLAAHGVPVVSHWSSRFADEPVLCLRAPTERLEDTSGVLKDLVDAAAEALSAGRFDAVIATGGETMAAVLDRIGSDRFELLGDIEPGFPAGRTMPSAAFPALTIAMKAGGFGSPASLLLAARTLLNAKENAGV